MHSNESFSYIHPHVTHLFAGAAKDKLKAADAEVAVLKKTASASKGVASSANAQAT